MVCVWLVFRSRSDPGLWCSLLIPMALTTNLLRRKLKLKETCTTQANKPANSWSIVLYLKSTDFNGFSHVSVRNIFWTEPDVNSGPVILAYIIVVLVLVRFNPSAVTQITCAGLLYWFREDFMSKGTNNAIRSCIQDNAI